MDDAEMIKEIERYLEAEMESEERLRFEAQIAADPAFAAKVKQYRLSQDAINLAVANDLKQNLEQWDREPNLHLVKVPTRRRWLLKIAAGIALLMSFAFLLSRYADRYTNYALAADSYTKPIFRGVRSSEGERAILTKGQDALTAGNYVEAVQFFGSVKDESLQIEARYYLAHGYFLQKEYNRAWNLFQEVMESKDVRFAEKSGMELFIVQTRRWNT